MRIPQSEIPEWLELTRSADPQLRCKALHVLCPCELKSNHGEVWARVLQMAGDPDAKVRRRVLHVLCDGSPAEYRPQVLEVLEGHYHDPDDRVRKGARRVLASYRHSGKVNIL